MGEMLKRSGGIGEKAQCDPPGHEVGTRHGSRDWPEGGVVHHLVGGCCIAEVVTQEKLTTGKNRQSTSDRRAYERPSA